MSYKLVPEAISAGRYNREIAANKRSLRLVPSVPVLMSGAAVSDFTAQILANDSAVMRLPDLRLPSPAARSR